MLQSLKTKLVRPTLSGSFCQQQQQQNFTFQKHHYHLLRPCGGGSHHKNHFFLNNNTIRHTAAAAATSLRTMQTTRVIMNKEEKKSLSVRIREEISHYKQGGKLLLFEARLSSKYIAKLVRGHTLTRRELRQLRRTSADLFRLVPFLVLIAIPFAEFALPFLLRFFPNMLPSTFQKSFEQEENRKKLLKMRMELAKFLQDTVKEMSISSNANSPVAADKNNIFSLPPNSEVNSAKDFVEFFHKLRNTGKVASTADVLSIARKFENELTLERLSRPQLVGMCKYMGIKAFGTDMFLRYQIRTKMRKLADDDQLIYFEGVDSLSVLELQKACSERGLRSTDVSPARLRLDLQQWLDLHLIHKIPSSLLILSRAFVLSDAEQADNENLTKNTIKDQNTEKLNNREPHVADALLATLESLPQTLIKEAELKMTKQPSFEKRLEAIKKEEDEIALECAAEEEAEEAEVAAAGDKSKEITDTKEQVKQLGSAIKVLASVSAIDEEREELASLQQAQAQAKALSHDHDEKPLQAAQAQVEKILKRVTVDIDEYERDVGSRLNLIKADEKGTVAHEDVEKALALLHSHKDSDLDAKRLVEMLDSDGDGRISIEELLAHAKRLEEQEGHGVLE